MASSDSEPTKVPITAAGIREALRVFAYLLPYRKKFIAALFCLFCSSLLGLAFPYFTGRLIDGAQQGMGGPNAGKPWTVAESGINSIALMLLGVLSVQALTSFFHTYLLAQVGEQALADMRRDTFDRVIRLPMTFFSSRRVGELSSRLASDLWQIQHIMTNSIPMSLRQLVLVAGGITLIFLTSFRLTLVMLGSFPVIMAAAILFGRPVRRISWQAHDRLAETNVIVEESLHGIASVKAFTNEDYETNRYRTGINGFVKEILRVACYQGVFKAFTTFSMYGCMVLLIWYGANMVEAGQLTIGRLAQFLVYTMYIGGAMNQFADLYSQVQTTMGATQRVRELLHEEAEDFDRHQPAASVNGKGPPPAFTGDFAFDQVTFAYSSRPEVTVLRNLSLTARAGQRIALVGPSGAGKSTIVSLLLRFYDPDSGRLMISGRDAREYPLHELRRHMAIVPQDVLLFGGTIAENIAYGKPGATQQEIEDAAHKANAHQFIAGFPEGYRTIVGERGIKLSGGQRQRVAIARAILRNPAILILDEATSSLDSESESLVQQALEGLMQDRTSVIVAHRLATVRKADCIYVIKEGQAVEAGTHAELLTREDGIYRNLSELQFGLA
jgi:ABC-type multidrug transport system fused ATPase/permease subunit